DRGQPELAVAGAWVELIAAAAKDAGRADFLLHAARQQDAGLAAMVEAEGRQDDTREDGSGPARRLVREEAVFDAQLEVAGATSPALAAVVDEAQRQGRGQLEVLDRPVIEVEPGIGVDHGSAAFRGRAG